MQKRSWHATAASPDETAARAEDRRESRQDSARGSIAVRGPRFSEEENEILVRGVLESYDLIYGCQAHETSSKRKKAIWRRIAEACSAVAVETRTVRRCQKRFSDCKIYTKKKMEHISTTNRGTGGGSPPELRLNGWQERLRQHMASHAVEKPPRTFAFYDSSRLADSASEMPQERPRVDRPREIPPQKGGQPRAPVRPSGFSRQQSQAPTEGKTDVSSRHTASDLLRRKSGFPGATVAVPRAVEQEPRGAKRKVHTEGNTDVSSRHTASDLLRRKSGFPGEGKSDVSSRHTAGDLLRRKRSFPADEAGVSRRTRDADLPASSTETDTLHSKSQWVRSTGAAVPVIPRTDYPKRPTPVISRDGPAIQQNHEKPQRHRGDRNWNDQQRAPFRDEAGVGQRARDTKLPPLCTVTDTLDLKSQRARNTGAAVPVIPRTDDAKRPTPVLSRDGPAIQQNHEKPQRHRGDGKWNDQQRAPFRDNQQTRSQGVATSDVPQHTEGVAASSRLTTVVQQHPEGIATSSQLVTDVHQHPEGVATSAPLATVAPQHHEGVATSSLQATVAPQHCQSVATSSQLTTDVHQHPDVASPFSNSIPWCARTVDGGHEKYCRLMKGNLQGTSRVSSQLNKEFGRGMHTAQVDPLEYDFVSMSSHLTGLSYTMDQISTLHQQALASIRAIESSKCIIAEEFKARRQYPNTSTPFREFSAPPFSGTPAELRTWEKAKTGPSSGIGPFCSVATASSPLATVIHQHSEGVAPSSQLSTVVSQHHEVATPLNNSIPGSACGVDGGHKRFHRKMGRNMQGASSAPHQLNAEFGRRMHTAQTDPLEHDFVLMSSHLTRLSDTMDQISTLQQQTSASMRAIASSKDIIAEEFKARRHYTNISAPFPDVSAPLTYLPPAELRPCKTALNGPLPGTGPFCSVAATAAVVPQHPEGVATSSPLASVVPQHHEGVATSLSLATVVPQHHEGVATSLSLATVVPQHHEGVATSLSLATVAPQHHEGVATSLSLATVAPQHHEDVATSSPPATIVPQHSKGVATSSPPATVVPQNPEGKAKTSQLTTVVPQHHKGVATSQLTTSIPQHPDVATPFSNSFPGSARAVNGGHESYRMMTEGNVQGTSSAPNQLGHRMHAAQTDRLEYEAALMNFHLTRLYCSMDCPIL